MLSQSQGAIIETGYHHRDRVLSQTQGRYHHRDGVPSQRQGAITDRVPYKISQSQGAIGDIRESGHHKRYYRARVP